MAERHRRANTTPEHEFAVEHAAAVREAALRLVESSEALLAILDEELEEVIDVTGSLSRMQDQLNALLGGDMERRLRSKLGVTRENVVAEPAPTAELNMLLLPPEDIQDEPTIDVDPDYPDGKTVERLDSGSAKTKNRRARNHKRAVAQTLSRQGIAKQELRAYYAELAALRRIQRERRELRNLMTEHPFKTNSTRDERIFMTHGSPSHRPKD